MWLPKGLSGARHAVPSPVRAGLIVGLVLSTAAMTPRGSSSASSTALPETSSSTDASAASSGRYLLSVKHKAAIPAFARKYSLACSACHTVWPELNPFGQAFKDRGYQLGNDRDSPIWQNPSYWPISARTTPNFHFETTTNQPIDSIPGNTAAGQYSGTVTTSGFDLSGIDILMFGTLYKNITFGLTPSSDAFGSFHIETAYVRFDNIGSTWVNLKMGKFELDNLISEKRLVTLSNNGGFYQNYHFVPIGDATQFGIGDNQLGIELMGHDSSSYRRYSVTLFSGTSGTPGFPAGTGPGLDAMIAVSQAFQSPYLGPQRIGIFGVFGQQATQFPTSGDSVIAGAGKGNKPFYRLGVLAQLWWGKFEFLPYYMRGDDNAYLAMGLPSNVTLPSGTRDATWNAGMLEAKYIENPQLAFIGRYEVVRMAQQADPATPSTYGNIDALVLGVRAYPFMFSRDGLAIHFEYAMSKTIGGVPLSGDGVGAPPLPAQPNTTSVMSSSVMLGLDFAF